MKKFPCIVYLHGNSGNRLEGMKLMKKIVSHKNKIAFMCFDFAGTGNSDGEYISLGWHESKDTYIILKELRKKFPQISKIVLWGRSMGAVSALLYTGKYKSNSAKY